MNINPTVIDKTDKGERAYDIYSRLLEDRIVFLVGSINQENSTSVISQLLFLDNVENKEINIYINSEGGFVTAGLAIYDTMQLIKSNITTVAIGQASSMGSLLLQGATKGMRYSTKNASIMIHQPSGGSIGTVEDIDIHTKHLLITRDLLENIYVQHNSKRKTKKQMHKLMERDCFLSPQDALRYGIIDKII